MADDGKIGLWPVVAIGVGGMVGGGIFAVLGLAVQLAHGGTPLAFLIAGAVALLTAYSYVKLSLAYPGKGGTVTFLNRAFGPGPVTGALNVLLWLSYIVMLSLYSYAFGSYGATFFPSAAQGLAKHALITAAVVLIAGLNLLSAQVIGKAENWIVALKIAILGVFVVVGVFAIEPSRLAVGQWSPFVQVAAGGMIIFLAYEGFELIANTADDIRDPERNLPRAYFIAVGFVVVLYVLVSAVTVGALDVQSIVDAKDFALAEAAKPFLGPGGLHPHRDRRDALHRVGHQRHPVRLRSPQLRDREGRRTAQATGAQGVGAPGRGAADHGRPHPGDREHPRSRARSPRSAPPASSSSLARSTRPRRGAPATLMPAPGSRGRRRSLAPSRSARWCGRPQPTIPRSCGSSRACWPLAAAIEGAFQFTERRPLRLPR